MDRRKNGGASREMKKGDSASINSYQVIGIEREIKRKKSPQENDLHGGGDHWKAVNISCTGERTRRLPKEKKREK